MTALIANTYSCSTVAAMLCTFSSAIAVTPSRASQELRDYQVVKEYSSPNKAYVLTETRKNPFWSGPAEYRLTLKEKVLWAAELDFTFQEAELTDDGVVGGYAYSGRYGARFGGDIRVILLDPSGKLRLNEATKRIESEFLHFPDNPFAVGLFLDPANSRMVVRVADPDVDRGHESWWTYRLSDGKPTGKFAPRALMPEAESADAIFKSGREVWKVIYAARPVAGTQYTLIHWRCHEYNARTRRTYDGARFSLVDLQGRPVWKLDLPHDYEAGGNKDEQERLSKQLGQSGAILSTNVGNQFDLWFAAEGRRVTFEVSKGGKAELVIQEISRRPYTAPPYVEPPPRNLAILVRRALQEFEALPHCLATTVSMMGSPLGQGPFLAPPSLLVVQHYQFNRFGGGGSGGGGFGGMKRP